MTYYEINSFQWSERVFSLREIVEYSSYLPFVVLVKEGYCSRFVEVTTDQIFWIHKIATRPCIIAKDEQGKYFSIPESLKLSVIQLKEVTPGCFEPASSPLALSELKNGRWCQYFRLVEGSTQVFDGTTEYSQFIKTGRLELIDFYQEKFLAAYPILSEPETEPDRMDGKDEDSTEAIYPHVTLIPVYLPLVITIALTMNDKSVDFFETMMKLNSLANRCTHDYSQLMESDAEIMLFDEAPIDDVYDYIQLKPFLEKSKKHKGNSRKDCHSYWITEDDSSDSDYEKMADPDEQKRIDVGRYRMEPIVKEDQTEPLEHLRLLNEILVSNSLSTYWNEEEEEEAPPVPPKRYVTEPAPPVRRICAKPVETSAHCNIRQVLPPSRQSRQPQPLPLP